VTSGLKNCHFKLVEERTTLILVF